MFPVYPSPVSFFREGNGTPLQYSCLENPMDGGAWWASVHGVTKSQTWLNNFTFTFHFHAVEKEMATHSSVLAWRIPGTGEPGGLLSIGTHRVGHDWSDLAAAAAVRFLLSFSIKICYYQGTIAHHVAKTNGQFSVLNSLDPSAAFSTAAHALFKNTSFPFRASRKNVLLDFL